MALVLSEVLTSPNKWKDDWLCEAWAYVRILQYDALHSRMYSVFDRRSAHGQIKKKHALALLPGPLLKC